MTSASAFSLPLGHQRKNPKKVENPCHRLWLCQHGSITVGVGVTLFNINIHYNFTNTCSLAVDRSQHCNDQRAFNNQRLLHDTIELYGSFMTILNCKRLTTVSAKTDSPRHGYAHVSARAGTPSHVAAGTRLRLRRNGWVPTATLQCKCYTILTNQRTTSHMNAESIQWHGLSTCRTTSKTESTVLFLSIQPY